MNAYHLISLLILKGSLLMNVGLENNLVINFFLIVLLVLIFIAAFFDVKSHIIPNIITYSGMLAALAFFSAINGFDGLLFSLKGIGLGIGLLIIPYIIGGMGAGDAKLMGVVGGFLGAKGVLNAFLVTAVVGGIYALLLMLLFRTQYAEYIKSFWQRSMIFISTRQYTPEPEDAKFKRPRLCYGLAISLGTALHMTLTAFGFNIL
jgi:prepilin peptidase CpaA